MTRAFSYPHPVLGSGDDVVGELSPVNRVDSHADRLVLTGDHSCDQSHHLTAR
jgi:hypothetical protein